LKTVSNCGRANTEKEMRLQLYKYPEHPISTMTKKIGIPIKSGSVSDLTENGSDIFQIYSNRLTATKYPSTLFVKLCATERPQPLKVKGRALNPNEIERGKQTYSELLAQNTFGSLVQYEDGNEEDIKDKEEELKRIQQELKRKKLKRDTLDKCEIPDKMVQQFETGVKGSLCIEFSNDGRYLAAGCCHTNTSSTVKVFDVWDGKQVANFQGHLNLIYSVGWSPDDREVASASSDYTVKIWKISSNKNKIINQQQKDKVTILQHPSFVYAAKYHPITKTIPVIATGSYDKKVRIWNRTKGTIITELEGHMGRVNNLCFTPDGTKLFSGDSTGLIKMWSCRLTKDSTENDIRDSFTLLKTIDVTEVLKSSLSAVHVDPNFPQERIIIHSQDNMIRRVESFRKSIKNSYSGVKNSKNAQKCTISPCGSYIVSGSETGQVYFWDTNTSKIVHAEGKNYGFTHSVFQVAWSQKEHLVAFCSFGSNEPIRIYAYEKKIEEKDATAPPTNNNMAEDTLRVPFVDFLSSSRPMTSQSFRWTNTPASPHNLPYKSIFMASQHALRSPKGRYARPNTMSSIFRPPPSPVELRVARQVAQVAHEYRAKASMNSAPLTAQKE
jgi:jouberin